MMLPDGVVCCTAGDIDELFVCGNCILFTAAFLHMISFRLRIWFKRS
jgi:hypothetical protein